ncbi:uncharacterized protein JCM6883_007619 [Sporobolomyces salmoneus]|uniref:uncharacterized protein n=1 Tax=Sporobolomyces salmoneus TaxID=183962 RepID=UPI00317858D9
MIKELWLSTLKHTQSVVTTLTVFFVLRIRTVHAVYFGAGTLVAAFSAKVLKKCIKQPRPEGAKKFEKTYGMPSTHSSSISFFGVYLSLSSLLLPLHPRITSLIPLYDTYVPSPSTIPASFLSHHLTSHPCEKIVRLLLAGFFIFGSASVCWSRVRLGHHTKAQVFAGAGLGSIIAFVWLSIWLGIDGWSQLVGTDLSRYLPVSLRAIPELVMTGLREPGQALERAGEDFVWLLVESWRDGQFLATLKEARHFLTMHKAGSEL